jgi:hypothetical protein
MLKFVSTAGPDMRPPDGEIDVRFWGSAASLDGALALKDRVDLEIEGNPELQTKRVKTYLARSYIAKDLATQTLFSFHLPLPIQLFYIQDPPPAQAAMPSGERAHYDAHAQHLDRYPRKLTTQHLRDIGLGEILDLPHNSAVANSHLTFDPAEFDPLGFDVISAPERDVVADTGYSPQMEKQWDPICKAVTEIFDKFSSGQPGSQA